MSQFKSSIRDHKINTERERIQRNTDLKYYAASFVICLLILFMLFVLLFSSYAPNTISSIKVKKNYSENSETIKKSTSADSLNNLLFIKEKSKNTISHIQYFREMYSSLSEKLYHNDTEEFSSAMQSFAKTRSLRSYQSYIKMKEFKEKITANIAQIGQLKENDIDLANSNYNTTIYNLAKMIITAYDSFKTEELKPLLIIEEINLLNLDAEKLIYQELHLKTILLTVIQIITAYEYIILEHVKADIKNSYFYDFCESWYSFVKDNNNNLFRHFPEHVKINCNKKSVKLSYLLSSILEYKRFLFLNVYIVFLHVFKITGDFGEIELNEYLYNPFLTNGQNRDSLVKSCGKVFKLEKDDEIDNEFIKMDSQGFRMCKECLFDNNCA